MPHSDRERGKKSNNGLQRPAALQELVTYVSHLKAVKVQHGRRVHHLAEAPLMAQLQQQQDDDDNGGHQGRVAVEEDEVPGPRVAVHGGVVAAHSAALLSDLTKW